MPDAQNGLQSTQLPESLLCRRTDGALTAAALHGDHGDFQCRVEMLEITAMV